MSIPVLHCFELGSLGRPEIIRMFFHEIGIQFKDIRYAKDETWAPKNESLGLSITGRLPILEIDGYKLSQHIPILHYLARRAGGYDGESNHDEYLVDAVSDIYIDWRTTLVTHLITKTAEYKKTIAPDYYRISDQYYSKNGGPYLLGNKLTYVDFAVFQMLYDNKKTGNDIDVPESLKRLEEALPSRPSIRDYLAQRG
ncbi:glutathione S-transferase [Trichoderma chlorosporum]